MRKKGEAEDAVMAVVNNMEELIEKEFDPEEDEITELSHFPIYNKWARKNKVPVKVPSEDFYPKYKVRFQRFQQPENILKCRVRNKDIDWQGALKPGGIYHLCLPVIQWLNSLCEPIFAEVKVDDGGDAKSTTKQVSERARFSCQSMEFIGV